MARPQPRPAPADTVESGWWPWLPPRWAVLLHQSTAARLIRIEERIMTAQDDIDQLTADLSRVAGEIKSEISGLDDQIAAGGAVDTSALRAAVEALDEIAPPVDAPADPAAPVDGVDPAAPADPAAEPTT